MRLEVRIPGLRRKPKTSKHIIHTNGKPREPVKHTVTRDAVLPSRTAAPEVHATGDAARPSDVSQSPRGDRAGTHTHGSVTGHAGHRERRYLMEFWFTKHSMQALRRHRKHSVMSCRLDARPSTWAGSLQASSTARDDFFRMSRTRWKMVLGAVSLKKGWDCYTTKK